MNYATDNNSLKVTQNFTSATGRRVRMRIYLLRC